MNRMRVLRLAAAFCAVVVSLSAESSLWATGGDMGVGTDPLTDGSEAHPWLIEDFNDFLVFADSANADTFWADGIHTRLECDLDLDSALPGRQIYTTAVIAPGTFEPSEYPNPNYSSYFNGTPYAGFFDGGGHVIRNLTIEGSNADIDYIGLWGGVGGNARISHLRLENIAITGGIDSIMVGGLCGEIFHQGTNYVILTDCHVDGSIQIGDDSRYIGGLCGHNIFSIITDCSAAMNITGGVSCQSLGGLCGENAGCLMNSQASGIITGSNSCSGLGGLCGTDNFETYWWRVPYDPPMPPITRGIDHCFATGAVSSGSSSYIMGGLCGLGMSILNSYATGTVTANPGSIAIGGLCGASYIITGSFASGNVSGYEIVGGLCGASGNVSNSYATGNVSGYKTVGGLCGLNGNFGLALSFSNKIISNCYATGVVTGYLNIGGLCGQQSASTAEINNSFWNTETSGTTVGYNLDIAHPGTINNVVGKTMAEMQTLSTFTDAGWDFVGDDGDPADWKMREKPYYPILAWQRDVYGDVAFDGVVNLADVALMAGQWMLTAADSEYLERCDLLDDDVIDGGDLAILAEYWLYPEITGDFNDEGGVNLADFAMLASAWQAVPSDTSYLPACNLDDAGASEGIIDLADLAIFCEHWLEGAN